MADDDFCVVCAEPLEWVAYGNCGHRDACSKCVSRLRFVMKDTRCLICQQQDSPVVVTRSLGAYTPVIPPQDFDKLQVSSFYLSCCPSAHWLLALLWPSGSLAYAKC